MRIVNFEGFQFQTNATDAELIRVGAKWLKKTNLQSVHSIVNFISLQQNLSARTLTNSLSDTHIRNLKGVSNSALSRFMHELKGTTPNFPARAMVFGRAFHEFILEPKKFNMDAYNLRPSEQIALKQMAMSVLINNEAHDLYINAKKEVARTWIDKKTGLKCKGQIDLEISKTDIGDVKTTSARTLKEFKDSLSRYDYDRQAAFYLNGIKGARRFWFIGVQKRKPFDCFVISYYCNSNFIRKGKKKFEFLIKKYKELK